MVQSNACRPALLLLDELDEAASNRLTNPSRLLDFMTLYTETYRLRCFVTLFFLFQKFSGLHRSGPKQGCTRAAKQGSRSSNATCPQSIVSCPQSSNYPTVNIFRHSLKFVFEQNMVYLCVPIVIQQECYCHTTRMYILPVALVLALLLDAVEAFQNADSQKRASPSKHTVKHH